MHPSFYLADRDAVDDAAELIAEHGPVAAFEASARASRSRELGNVIHFCRWRQIERFIEAMASDEATGAVH